jgi:hypothetical protein
MNGPVHTVPDAIHQLRRALSRRSRVEGRAALTDQVTTVADALAAIVSDATDLDVPVPPPITNAILDLRGWAGRIRDDSSRPTTVDATRLLTHLRELPDTQLLALLADLPWARMDALIDAIAEPTPEPPSTSPKGAPHSPQSRTA